MAKKRKRRTFAEILYDKLKDSELGPVEHGKLDDGSGQWVSLSNGKKELCISFDSKGNRIDRVGVWEDIVEVVDTKRIF